MLTYEAGAGRAGAVADEARVKRRRRGTQLEMLTNLLPPPQARAHLSILFECVCSSMYVGVYVGGVCAGGLALTSLCPQRGHSQPSADRDRSELRHLRPQSLALTSLAASGESSLLVELLMNDSGRGTKLLVHQA